MRVVCTRTDQPITTVINLIQGDCITIFQRGSGPIRMRERKNKEKLNVQLCSRGHERLYSARAKVLSLVSKMCG